MSRPLILSTWSFGHRANAAAWGGLGSGGNALNAVEAACRDAEADLTNHTVGAGGYPDRDGEVSLDASIMASPARGAVAGVKRFVHAISIARAVMEKTPHRLLVGSGAEKFAEEHGFVPQNLLTDDARAAWQRWERNEQEVQMRNIEEHGLRRGPETHDTIGVLALDSGGTLAGACTTSGLAFKLPGRVGDSPIIGHGLYVDPNIGAAVTTGRGELVTAVCGTFLAVEALRQGASPLEAAEKVLTRIMQTFDLTPQDQVGIIVLTSTGDWSAASLRPGFRVAVRTVDRDELVDPARVMLA